MHPPNEPRRDGPTAVPPSFPAPGRLRVSVALCTHNGGRHLRQQLDSLAAQTRRPDELIVGDDASTDETPATLDAFARDAGLAVRVHRNPEPLGVTGNFEATFGRCTGDVILPCDQDDAWLAERVARTIEPFERDPAVTYAICQSMRCDADLRPLGRTVFDTQRFGRGLRARVAAGEGFAAFLRHNVAPGHASAFRRELLPLLRPIPTTCIYDQWVALIASAVGRTALVDEPLVMYRSHEAQQTVGADRTLGAWAAHQDRVRLDHLQRARDTHAAAIERLAGRLPSDREGLLRGKLAFLDRRLAMRGGRLRRTREAFRLLVTGAYARHGRGMLTFARDLRGGKFDR